MLTFKKGDWVKFIDPSSTLISVLKAEGWKAEGEVEVAKEDSNLDALRAEAEVLGLKVHHKTGAEKLSALIAEARAAA
jgi:hypothetical protein